MLAAGGVLGVGVMYESSVLALVDLSFLLTTLVPFVGLLAVMFLIGRRNARYLRKQSGYLDHQQKATSEIVAQNKSYEEMIARQYVETNTRSDKALAQGDDALRMQAEALEQLKAMNAMLSRLSDQLAASGRA